MDVKNFTKNGDFRTLKEGTLLRLVEGGQPVVFEGIDERPASHASDMAVVICLDPVEGLTRLRYPLQEESNYINRFEG
ncbi:unnamed protein product, partial [marine sediment metagenome]